MISSILSCIAQCAILMSNQDKNSKLCETTVHMYVHMMYIHVYIILCTSVYTQPRNALQDSSAIDWF